MLISKRTQHTPNGPSSPSIFDVAFYNPIPQEDHLKKHILSCHAASAPGARIYQNSAARSSQKGRNVQSSPRRVVCIEAWEKKAHRRV